MTTSERTRLHITPFNETLLDRYVPASLKPQASGISFHAVQTFPEKSFGFVELPKEEAMKLKKKFNGTTLKGAKVHIEEARSEKKRKHGEGDDDEEDERAERKARKLVKKEKRKKENGVIPGHEIEDGRKVKRGWKDEDAKTSRKAEKAEKKTEKVLFKAGLPSGINTVDDKKSKEKRSKEEKKEKRRDKRKQQAVVEEFRRNRQPVALKDGVNLRHASDYVDGVGWVGEDGEVVEAETEKTRRKRERHEAKAKAKMEGKAERKAAKEAPEPAVAQSREESFDSVVESQSGSEEAEPAPEDRRSSMQQKSDAESASDAESPDKVSGASDQPTTEADERNVDRSSSPIASDSSDHESAKASEITTKKEVVKEIHPLEALYKRPAASGNQDASSGRPKPPAINTSFSLFGFEPADNDSVDGTETRTGPPQTPHTKQDLEWRGQRSAAPTPDTAAIGKRFSFSFGNGGASDNDDIEEEDEAGARVGALELRGNTEANAGAAMANAEAEEGEPGEESEFRKFFYEHRGDNNRAWKRKRREGKKVMRQRENRRVSRRVV